MYRKFEERGIPYPKTYAISAVDEIKHRQITFPLLLKESHSRSAQGIFKVDDLKALKELIESPDINKRNNGVFIVQELLNIRRDLRVIVIGGEIALHYWRINKYNYWRPTSTSFGSDVDFEYFPEQWRTHILETLKKLDLTAGAFDIAWQNDDLSNTPLYLEVSPSYQPNPKPYRHTDYYGIWKKSFIPSNNYEKAFIDLVFDLEDKYLEECLKTASRRLPLG